MATLKCGSCGDVWSLPWNEKWECRNCGNLHFQSLGFWVLAVAEDDLLSAAEFLEGFPLSQKAKAITSGRSVILRTHRPEEFVRVLPMAALLFDVVIAQDSMIAFFSEYDRQCQNTLLDLWREDIMVPLVRSYYGVYPEGWFFEQLSVSQKEKAKLREKYLDADCELTVDGNGDGIRLIANLASMLHFIRRKELGETHEWAGVARELASEGITPAHHEIMQDEAGRAANRQTILGWITGSAIDCPRVYRHLLCRGTYSDEDTIEMLSSLLKQHRLQVPTNVEVKRLLALRATEACQELREVVGDAMIASCRVGHEQALRQLSAEYEQAVLRFNSEASALGDTVGICLAGVLSTVGALSGGPLGAALGGVGAAGMSLITKAVTRRACQLSSPNWAMLLTDVAKPVH